MKKAKARVLCPLTFKMPPTSIHAQLGSEERERAQKEIYVKNPAKLAEAGIPFAFSSLGTDDPKSFMEGIQKALENGLPQEKALEALTINAARFLGLEKALGTIEPGKDADLAAFSRHPLDPFTICEMTLIDGQVYFDRAKYLEERKKAEEEKKKKEEEAKKPKEKKQKIDEEVRP